MTSRSEFSAFLAQQQTRRAFLGRTAQGVGQLALASLLNPVLFAAAAEAGKTEKWSGVVNPFHYKPKAKRVIWLTMAGGPSHLETFDPKPKLGELNGEPFPESITKGKQIAQLQGQKLVCFAPQHKFAKFGENQTEICELFPQIGSVSDDICLVRSMTTEAITPVFPHTTINR